MSRSRSEQAVDDYVAAWNERDDEARRASLERAVTDDCEFEGPTGIFRGRPALDGLIVALQARMGDTLVARTGPLDEDLCFGWVVQTAGGVALLVGVDVVDTAADGRLSRIAVRTAPAVAPAPGDG